MEDFHGGLRLPNHDCGLWNGEVAVGFLIVEFRCGMRNQQIEREIEIFIRLKI